MNILIPVDGSDLTKRTLAYLAAHDELLSGAHAYTFLTVISPNATHEGNFSIRMPMDQFMNEQAESVLEPLRAFAHQNSWNATFDYVPGNPAQEILGKAETLRPDLIVMGTHGRSALGCMLMGSVATSILAGCKVPVLLIR